MDWKVPHQSYAYLVYDQGIPCSPFISSTQWILTLIPGPVPQTFQYPTAPVTARHFTFLQTSFSGHHISGYRILLLRQVSKRDGSALVVELAAVANYMERFGGFVWWLFCTGISFQRALLGELRRCIAERSVWLLLFALFCVDPGDTAIRSSVAWPCGIASAFPVQVLKSYVAAGMRFVVNVGNEPLAPWYNGVYHSILSACVTNMINAISAAGLVGAVKVTVPFQLGVLSKSWPPSAGVWPMPCPQHPTPICAPHCGHTVTHHPVAQRCQALVKSESVP